MLSAVITALLLIVMLLIIANLIVGAWREHQRQRRLLLDSQAKTHPLSEGVTTVLQWQNGLVVGVEKSKSLPSVFLPHSWYTGRRTLVSLGFMVMVLLTLFLQDGLADGTLQTLTKGIDLTFLGYAPQKVTTIQTNVHQPPVSASVRLVRIDSASPKQYYTSYQLNVWSYSSCSGIAMAMVMNAYGRHLIAADVLQEELNLGVWDIHLGLLREEGIAMTAAHYGFKANLSHAQSLQDIVALANKGQPVIVGIRDSYYFPGGHILVVRGGDKQYVYLADSSPANFQRMSYSMFSGMWQGFSAILTPQ